jgi:LmbE family N-acetylglucosaminyl deacetylase
MTASSTLVCVHAHPDDEALFTAGITSHYAELGFEVVLVTCTDGGQGLDQNGRPGSDPRHDRLATLRQRASELQRAASHVGYTRVVNLGYEDSGMTGWPQNENPQAFLSADVEAVARTLAALFDEVGADVVVTYDERGFYGHPDHVMANRVSRRAVELSGSTQRLYYPVVPRGVLRRFTRDAVAQGVNLPAWIIEATPDTPDELVACVMDVTGYANLKQEAIAMHGSQIDNADLVTMSAELFTLLFGTEYYQRAWSRSLVEGDRNDLFGGM